MAKSKSKFRRRLPLIGIFVLLIIGLSFFMYPIVSNWYTEYSARVVIREYDEAVQKMGYESLERFTKQAEDYNRSLSGNGGGKSVVSYSELLAVTEAIGYIDVPKIGAYYPIYHGLSDDVLQKGIGHMEGTSLPIGGESTHCVLAGHTGLPSSKLFTDLDILTVGDTFYIHVLDKVLKYRIDQIKTVLPNESDDVRIEQGKDYVTLVTCTPYGVNDHRLLVRGARAPIETVEKEDEEQVTLPVYHKEETQIPARTMLWYFSASAMGIMVLGILVILLIPVFKRKKGKKSERKQDTVQDKEQKPDENSESMED